MEVTLSWFWRTSARMETSQQSNLVYSKATSLGYKIFAQSAWMGVGVMVGIGSWIGATLLELNNRDKRMMYDA